MNAPSQLLIQFGEQEVAIDFPEQTTLAAGNKAGVDIQIGDSLEDGAIFFELRNLGGGEIQVCSAGAYLLLINEKEIEAEKYALPITLQMPELGLDCRLLLREGSLALPPLPDLSQVSEEASTLEQLPPIPSAVQAPKRQRGRSRQGVFAKRKIVATSLTATVLLLLLGVVFLTNNHKSDDKKPSVKTPEDSKPAASPSRSAGITPKEKMPSSAQLSAKAEGMKPSEATSHSKELEEAERLASSGDTAGAVAIYRTLASANNPQAANALGTLLVKTGGNPEEAISFFQKAASANNEKAIYNMALCYLNGIGVKADNQKAVELLQKASDLGNPEAMLLLADLHSQGKGGPVDDASALALCEKAAAKGSPEGLVALAMKYIKGSGVKRNIPKSMELLESAVAMKNTSAMNNLATLYARGQGVERDIGKAKSLYRDAANLGDEEAKANLLILEQGDTSATNTAQARSSASPSPEGDQDSRRTSTLSNSGRNREEASQSLNPEESSGVLDFHEAISRADAGDAYAQAIVSIYYGVGYKTQKDSEKAAEFAMKSAKQGHPLGIYRLGAMRQTGEGMANSEDQGKKLRAQSVEGLNKMESDPYALTALGVMLYRGEVIKQNKAEAARLYRLAANQGYAPAQYSYAVCLNQGVGVEKNPDLAKTYLDKSAAQFYPPALEGMPK